MFRGSDVKDLHVCEAPAQQQQSLPPQVPNDPAILGVRILNNWYLNLKYKIIFVIYWRYDEKFGC